MICAGMPTYEAWQIWCITNNFFFNNSNYYFTAIYKYDLMQEKK